VAGLLVLLLVATMGALAVGVRASAGDRRETGRGLRRRPPPDWVREPRVSRAEAERRSLDLLRSVVNPDEWEMYRELGFICVTGHRPSRGRTAPPRYRYLIYPHLPVVAVLPRSMAPVREYCVRFPERGDAADLPTGDDLLAKWMTLRSDEGRLLRHANVSSPGCQIPLGRIERDIARLRRWRSLREAAGPPPAPHRGPALP
jgi:hypothetical protein